MPPKEHWWIVLADFGISKRADDGNAPTTGIKGTDGFKAPELLGLPNFPRPKEISGFQAADMWALGEMAYRMLTGKATFQSQWELMEYCREERKFPSFRLPSSAEGDGEEFIRSLMKSHPNGRITTIQGLEHPWMSSQCASLEESIGRLDSEHNSSAGVARSAIIPNHSASWAHLSSNGSESAKTTTQWKPGDAFRPDQKGSKERHLEQLDNSPRIRQNPSTGQDSPSTPMLKVNMFDGHRDTITAIAFTPDGKALASASMDSTIKLWDGRSGALLKKLKDQYGAVTALAFSQDGETMAWASGSACTIKLWDTRSERLLRQLYSHTHNISQVAFSPDSKSLVSVAIDSTVILWDARSGAVLGMVKAERHEIGIRVAFSPDGNTLATSNESTVALWDNQLGKRTKKLRLNRHGLKVTVSNLGKVLFNVISAIGFSPDSETLAAVWTDHTVTLWDTRSGAVQITFMFNFGLSTPVGYGVAVVFSPDGKTLAASFGEFVGMWDSRSLAVMKTLEGHSKRITGVAFSPDSKAVATASEDGRVGLWSLSLLNSTYPLNLSRQDEEDARNGKTMNGRNVRAGAGSTRPRESSRTQRLHRGRMR
jgi:WD40 repeat protein